MTTYLNSGLATQSSNFRLRIQAAIFRIAQDVMNESVATPKYVDRQNLAKKVIWTPDLVLDRFVWLCASNPSIAASVVVDNGVVTVNATDNDLAYVCTTTWNTVAEWSKTLV